MKGRGRGIRGRKLEKPRPLRSQSDGGVPSSTYMLVTDKQEQSKFLSAMSSVAVLEEMLIDVKRIEEDDFLMCVEAIVEAGKYIEVEQAAYLDKLYSVIRNALVDAALHPRWRAHLLQLLELRACSWEMGTLTSEYYHSKLKEVLSSKNEHDESGKNKEENKEEESILVTGWGSGTLNLAVKRRYAEVFTTQKAHGMIAMVTGTFIRNISDDDEWLKFEVQGKNSDCGRALQMFMERIESSAQDLPDSTKKSMKKPPPSQRGACKVDRGLRVSASSNQISGASKVPLTCQPLSRRSSEPAYLGSAAVPRLPGAKSALSVASTTLARARGRGRGRAVTVALPTSPSSSDDISPPFCFPKTSQDHETSDGRFDDAPDPPKFNRSISSPEKRNISRDRQIFLEDPSSRANGTTSARKLFPPTHVAKNTTNPGSDSLMFSPHFPKADLNQNILRKDSATALMLGKNPSLPVVKASDLDEEVEFWGDEEESQLDSEIAKSFDSKTSDGSISKDSISVPTPGLGNHSGAKLNGHGVVMRHGFGNVTSTPAARQHRKSLGAVDSFNANISAIDSATRSINEGSSMRSSRALEELNEAFDRSSMWTSLKANQTINDTDSVRRGRDQQRGDNERVRSRSLGRSLSGGDRSLWNRSGYIQSKNIVREPIHPLTDKLELIMIEREMPGGKKSAKERRTSFNLKADMNRKKMSACTKTFGAVMRYNRDILLQWSTSPLSRQPPEQIDKLWDHFPEIVIKKNYRPFDPADYKFIPSSGASYVKKSNLTRLPSFDSHKVSDIMTHMTGANDRLLQ